MNFHTWLIQNNIILYYIINWKKTLWPSCRLLSFLNYFAAQSSAWLYVFICLDRYLVMSRVHQTWFSHSTCVLIIILIFILFNLYFIIFGYSYKENGTISIQSKQFTIYPRWDYVNLDVYNCVPFLLMIIFNSGLIYHLFRLHHTNIDLFELHYSLQYSFF